MHEHPHNHTDPSPDILNPRRAMLAGLGGLAAGAFLASTAHAGPLNPPAGPIAPTPGPEPRIAVNATNTPPSATGLFTISQPGSYFLTGNIDGAVSRNGIEINASGVTLDLNGFEMRGFARSLSGILVRTLGQRGIHICNGSVRQWDGNGIDLSTYGPTACSVSNIRVTSCSGTGIRVGNSSRVAGCVGEQNTTGGLSAGQFCVIESCSMSSNAGYGINAAADALITGCNASFNGASGIVVGGSSRVCGCTVNNNTTYGVSIPSGSYTIVEDCTINSNTEVGVRLAQSYNVVRRCLCCGNLGSQNTAVGIQVLKNENVIEGNYLAGNGYGLYVLSGNRTAVLRNTFADNVAGNFFSLQGATLSAPFANDNAGLDTHPANANISQS